MGRKFGWHSGKLTCKDLTVQNTMNMGTLDFGAAELDSILIKGRMSTSTLAGAALSLGSAYTTTYGELLEFRCTVTALSQSFKGYYFRTEATAGNASYGLRGMEVFCVPNITSGSTGIAQAETIYAELALKHGAASWTLGNSDHAVIEANVSIYAGSGTLTIGTSDLSGIYIKIQGANGVADYTKINGLTISARDADSSTRRFGDAIAIQDPGDAFVAKWTTAIDIKSGCTRGIRVGTHDWGAGVTGLEISTTDPLMQVAGKVTSDGTAGVYCCSYDQMALTVTQTKGSSYFATWSELYITGGTITLTGTGNFASIYGYVNATGTVTTGTGNITALNGAIEIPATFTNNGRLSCLQVDMILNNGYTDNGIIAGIQFGEHTDPGQNKIPYGLNFDAGACACFARFPDDAVIADADGTTGSAAGYILVNIGGNDYKLKTYATA